MAKLGGANRIELESQVLSAALRQSRSETDSPGVALACRELSNLFPDLLPSPECHGTSKPPQALNQWFRYPEIPLVELVLQAGYVSESEMRSLQVLVQYSDSNLPPNGFLTSILEAVICIKNSLSRLSKPISQGHRKSQAPSR